MVQVDLPLEAATCLMLSPSGNENSCTCWSSANLAAAKGQKLLYEKAAAAAKDHSPKNIQHPWRANLMELF